MVKAPSLAQLLDQRGVKVSAQYRNANAAATFTRCLAQVVRKWRLDEVRTAGYFGLMIDEGTDIGWESVLIEYVKYVNQQTGWVHVKFHKLMELQAKDAGTLTEGILQQHEEDRLDVKKMASLGADGASVMSGELSGVGAQLQKLNPFLLRHHDCAHREALASRGG